MLSISVPCPSVEIHRNILSKIDAIVSEAEKLDGESQAKWKEAQAVFEVALSNGSKEQIPPIDSRQNHGNHS